MAIHSNTFAWRIPWTEEPHGLQSIWSQRVRHDRRPLAHVIGPGGSLVRNNRQCRRQRGCGLTAGSGRSPDVGNGKPLQYSCLENPMDRGPWWATVHMVTKSQTNEAKHSSVLLHHFYLPLYWSLGWENRHEK